MKELRGTESTRKSIQKLKKGERMAANPVGNTDLSTVRQSAGQAVYIFISYRGVQFVDIQSQVCIPRNCASKRPIDFLSLVQGAICEHEIRNINCACQDSDDLSNFAYITKDSEADTHYCHVFNVATMVIQWFFHLFQLKMHFTYSGLVDRI